MGSVGNVSGILWCVWRVYFSLNGSHTCMLYFKKSTFHNFFGAQVLNPFLNLRFDFLQVAFELTDYKKKQNLINQLETLLVNLSYNYPAK